MQKLLTRGETGEGIVICSWKEFKKNSESFSPDCMVRGIRLFSEETKNPQAVLKLLINHPDAETILSRLHSYGELHEGYLIETLKLSLKKLYCQCAELIDKCAFKTREEIRMLRELLTKLPPALAS